MTSNYVAESLPGDGRAMNGICVGDLGDNFDHKIMNVFSDIFCSLNGKIKPSRTDVVK